MTWPSFVNPLGAVLFLAAIPLVILYFLKLRRPRVEIPSLVLWQSVVNDQRVNSPFQKFRRNLLLLLQLLILTLLVLALTQPFIGSAAGTAEFTPILIDCSASMSAIDPATGETRLSLILDQVRERINNLRSDQQFALFTFASTGRRLTEFTNDRRVLLQALESIEATDLPAQLDDVLRMAAAYTTSFPIREVILLTDGNLPESVEFELPFSLQVKRLQVQGANLGITEMTARRDGKDGWELFIRITGASEELQTAELQLYQNGEQIFTERISAAAGDGERLVFPIETDTLALVEARLIPAGEDVLETDNRCWLTLPATRSLQVLTLGQLTTWQRAVNVLDGVEQEVVTGGVPDQTEYDLIISDGEIPEGINAPVTLFVDVIPEDLSGLIEKREDVCTVTDWNRTAPLLQHVSLGDVQIGEQPAWGPEIGLRELEERGYEVLAEGNAGPLLLQKREGLKTTWWFTFHTDRSTLPYRVGFPILAANAVNSSLKQAALSEVSAAPTGVLPALQLDAGQDYQVEAPDGSLTAVRSGMTGLLTGIGASEVGQYRVRDGNDVVSIVGTGLLSLSETSLSAVDELRFAEVQVDTDATIRLETDRPLWWGLALGAFVVMLVEWWYFQRVRGVVD
ncbi:MAG: vWA domain-containing protein [Planctomycetaceae bacterium]